MYYNQLPRNLTYNGHQQSSLAIYGEGTIQIEPDTAIITLGVTTENELAEVAQANNTNIIAKVIQSLQQIGISPDDIKTTEYRMNIQYDYVEGKQLFRGYEVVHMLEVKIKQLDQTGKVIDTAVKNGANTVTNLYFTTSQAKQLYNEALAMAVKNAQQKALITARSLNVILNETPLKILELSQATSPSALQVTPFAKSTSPELMPGQIEIKATIKAKFSYFK